MHHPTGKHINYYHICHRKLWLFDHGISMQHGSEAVQDGDLLHKTAYPTRAARYREIQIEGIKIDFYDPQERVVHEIKRSEKLLPAQIAQTQFYLYVLGRHGIAGATGLLEFPKQRRTEVVPALTAADEMRIAGWLATIGQVVAGACPAVINRPICKECAYYEFCYAGEAG